LIIIIIFILSKYINISKIEREKITAYECGFQEFLEETVVAVGREEIKKKYYLKYYIIAIIFLIFDLEILLLYPFITSFSSLLYNNNNNIITYNIFPSFKEETINNNI
jgi:NADH-quinone oxidoreductase subunit A